MNRRPPGGALTSGGDAARFPGGLSGPLALLAAAIGLLLLIVVIFALAARCTGGGSTAQAADCSGKAPAAPAGFTYASRYCSTQERDLVGKSGSFDVPLTDKSSTRGLSFYSYDGGAWKRLAAAQVTQDGAFAHVDSAPVPKTFAVLVRSSDFQVFGTVPRGGTASDEAQSIMTVGVPVFYTPTGTGDLAGSVPPVPKGIPFAVVPAITAEGGADAQTVNNILQDPAKQSVHVDRIAAAVEQGGYDGIEIDYPAVDSALKSNFTGFIQALATRLHQSKKKLIVRAPLPRREGNAWNALAYDWQQLGRSADYLVMVAEKDQSIYRTRVPEAVKYLVSQVPDSKRLILEVTPLSEVKNEQGQLTTLSTLDALSIAGQITVRDPDQVYGGSDVTVSADNINRENGSGPDWTPQGVVSFQYRADDGQRSVWIENEFSVGYKLEIIELDRLGGVAVDDASANPAVADVWPAIAHVQSTGTPLLERPNPQALRPSWIADGRPIPDAGSRAQITWHAPLDPGRHTLAVIVSDGTMRVQNSTVVTVREGSPPPGATPAAHSSATATAARGSATRAAPSATRTSGR